MEIKPKADHWLYLLFVASLPFPTLFESRVFGVNVLLPDVLFLFAAAATITALIARRERPRLSAFHICLAAYGIAVALSTITSANPAQSSVKLVGKFYLIGIAALTFELISSGLSLKRVASAWLTGAALAVGLSLIGIVLFYFGVTDPSRNIVVHPIFGSLPPGNYPRIEGFFAYPAMFCNFLGVSWMLLLMLAFSGWIRLKYAIVLAGALLVVNAFTLTPGLGGIFLSTGYFAYSRLKGDRLLAGSLALGAGTAVAAAFLFAASFTLFSYGPDGTRVPLSDGELTLSHRARAWTTSLQTFLEDPIVGRGVGMPIARSEFVDPSGNRQLLTDAHNTYLSLLGETGLLGFAAFVGVVLFATLGVFQWKTDDPGARVVKLALLLALADGFFYQSLTGSYEDTRHLWVLFGIAAAYSATKIPGGSEQKKRPLPAS